MTSLFVPCNSGDQDFLWDILYEALWDPPSVPRRPRSVLEKPVIAEYVRDWGHGAHDSGFVATTGSGERVGAVWSRLLLPPLSGGAFFDDQTPQLGIAVFPPWQGRGIGGRLLRHPSRRGARAGAADFARRPSGKHGGHPALSALRVRAVRDRWWRLPEHGRSSCPPAAVAARPPPP